MPSSSNTSALLREAEQRNELLRAEVEALRSRPSEPIAVVGMGCRFPPDVRSPAEFWQLLRNGVDAVREVPPDRWDVDALYDPDPDVPGRTYSRWGGFLETVDLFDPQFFGISPREAAAIDPQQRLLLEVSWEALEHAGQAPSSWKGSNTGVYVGLSMDDYSQLSVNSGDLRHIDALASLGVARCVAAGRVAYCLDLRGPTMQLDTACSSSLLAVHLAGQALRLGETDMALAGGVNVMLSPSTTIAFSKLRALSPTGRCRTFDSAADGYVRGEGCGMLVLKRLGDARAAGDRIWAVLRGSAVNQDGRSNGLTAPNGSAQEALIRQALKAAGVRPTDIQYVETHGTATPLGDPIEVLALSKVLCDGRAKDNPLALGSVKTNFGHLESAAGIAGLMKLILALRHKTIPPHLHVRALNPRVRWNALPLTIPTEARPWPSGDAPRLGGISAFGMSGTNVHLVVEEMPHEPRIWPDRARNVLALSARTASALTAHVRQVKTALEALADDQLGDFCDTAAAGRAHFEYRAAVAGGTKSEMLAGLDALLEGRSAGHVSAGTVSRKTRSKIAFLYTGQGSQYPNMARDLYATSSTFRQALDRCAELFAPYLDRSLLDILDMGGAAGSELRDTAYAQPALFAVEYALTELLRAAGIHASGMSGHSIGECVAAWAAGVFDLETAVSLVGERARFMQSMQRDGQMVAAFAPEALVTRLLAGFEGDVAIASVNGPHQVVLSGRRAPLDSLLAKLAKERVRTLHLEVSHAFHSPMMDPMLDGFEAAISKLGGHPPQLDLVSNLTGDMADASIGSPRYWRRQVREPVRFADGLSALQKRGYNVFIEVGPQPVLVQMARACLSPDVVLLSTLGKGRNDWVGLFDVVAKLYVAGRDPDWAGFGPMYARRSTVDVPTYPFARERHWLAWPQNIPRTPEDNRYRPANDELLSEVPASEFSLAADTPAYLSDHRIYGHVVVPAAEWLSLLADRVTYARRAPASLDGVKFTQALSLVEGTAARVRVAFQPASDGGPDGWVVKSRIGDSPWRTHAVGRVGSFAQPERPLAEGDTHESIRRQCQTEVDPQEIYADQQIRHIALGPSFRWLQRVYRGEAQALGEFSAPADEKRSPRCRSLHPGLIDSCFQLLGATVALPPGQTLVPVMLDRLRIHRPGPLHQGWCAVKATRSTSGNFVGDVRLYDHRHELVAEFVGLEAMSVTRDAILASSPAVTGGLAYDLEWREVRQAAASPAAPRDRGKLWLLFADDTGLAGSLSPRLEQDGDSCLLAEPGDEYRFADDGLTLDPGKPEHFERLLTDVAASYPPLGGVVHLWSLRSDAGQDSLAGRLERHLRFGSMSLLHLVQALGRAALHPAPRLWVVTRGAQQVRNEPELCPEQTLLWGMGAALSAEHPEFSCTRVDLDPRNSAGVEFLHHEFTHAPDEPCVAERGGVRWIPRLRRAEIERHEGGARGSFRENRTYLITGGLGALGLRLAEELASHGARSLLLCSRRPATGPALDRLSRIRQSGATVTVIGTDVSTPDGVSAILDALRSTALPPLGGVFHAAGRIDDGMLVTTPWGRFESVLAPKVLGALLLHEATKDFPLDYFVCFSSLVSIVGSAGQASYAAANAYLDLLARYRRARGLPGLSINWGPWDGEGMAASLTAPQRARMVAHGIKMLQPGAALDEMRHALAGERAQVVIAAIDWSKVDSRMASARIAADLTIDSQERPGRHSVAPPMTTASDTKMLSDLATFSSCPVEERKPMLVQFLRAALTESLGIEPGALDLDVPLQEIGMDSLMLLDVSSRLRKAGVTMDVQNVPVGASLRTLVDGLVARTPADSSAASPRSACLVPFRREGRRPPFFCVHAVGGDVACYQELARLLPPDQPFYALRAHGLEEEDDPLHDVERMASAYLAEVRSLQPSGPYRIGGWSLGGVIAFEMARQLDDAGERTSHLILIDSYAPFDASRELEDLDGLSEVTRDLNRILGTTFEFPEATLRDMNPQDRLSFLIEQAGELDIVAASAGPRNVFKANIRAMYEYRPGAYPGPAHAICAEQAARGVKKDAGRSWSEHIRGGLRIEVLPGDHYSILQQAAPLAHELGRLLDCAEGMD